MAEQVVSKEKASNNFLKNNYYKIVGLFKPKMEALNQPSQSVYIKLENGEILLIVVLYDLSTKEVKISRMLIDKDKQEQTRDKKLKGASVLVYYYKTKNTIDIKFTVNTVFDIENAITLNWSDT